MCPTKKTGSKKKKTDHVPVPGKDPSPEDIEQVILAAIKLMLGRFFQFDSLSFSCISTKTVQHNRHANYKKYPRLNASVAYPLD